MSQKKNKAETTQEILNNGVVSEEKQPLSQDIKIISDKKIESKKSASDDKLAKLIDCFKAWPDVKELWQTSDGTCFFHKADAVNYARTISGEVKLFKRDELQNSKK